MNEVRKTILFEEELVASKRRFGLFSQPPPIAVGDDSQYQHIIHTKGPDGKPVTNPPQMLGGTCKTGMTKKSYFQVPQSIYQGDKYTDDYKRQKQYERKLHTKATFHQKQFIPSSGESILSKPSYTYTEQKQFLGKPIQRDETGKVKTKLPNILTNPTTKVQKNFLKNPQYISDPYDRKKKFELQEKEDEKQKRLPEAPLFRSMSHGNKSFMKDSLVYGEDNKTKSMIAEKKNRSKSQLNIVNHETKFVLARRGHGDPIGKYPEFIEKGVQQRIFGKKTLENKQQNKEVWKYNNHGYSRPTPSISLIKKNINLGKK